MANPEQLAQFIRFRLHDLGSQNAHHEFEHLCRYVTKARFVSNVIPATGPVSAKGDQGRDFETFRTYLKDELPFSVGFLALATEDTVACACTLRSKDLRTKIKSDVESICSQGTPVDQVYFFTSEGLASGIRHEVQDEVRAEHGVELEIVDGAALSELLADPELYWIAEEYLHLPAELQPPPPEPDPSLPGWYVKLRGDWQARTEPPSAFGDLLELSRCLRYATFHDDASRDLAGWMQLTERILNSHPDLEMRQRVRYELAVAHLRGTGTLVPAEQHVLDFFAELNSVNSPTLLSDASRLLQYCSASSVSGTSNLTWPQVAAWIDQTRERTRICLEASPHHHARSILLEVTVTLALQIDNTLIAEHPLPPGEQIEIPVGEFDYGDLPPVHPQMPLLDLDGGMAALVELVDALPDARMLPIEALTERFSLLTPILVGHAQYSKVRDGLDAVLAAQGAHDKVAHQCLQRAMQLARTGQLLHALRELHEAKINWWHGDTLHESLHAMNIIADIYGHLHMPLAAKKYALAVAAIAMQSTDDHDRYYVPRALFQAASYDHQAGAWITSAETTAVALLAQLQYTADPINFGRFPYLKYAITQQQVTFIAAQQHRPALVDPLRQILDVAGFGQHLYESITESNETTSWDEQQWIESTDDMTAAPFADADRQWQTRFSALGLRWRVVSDNHRTSVLAAEEFTASMQVLLVELASLDPLFLPADLEIEVRTPSRSGAGTFDFDAQSSQEHPDRWIVDAPTGPVDVDRWPRQLLKVAVKILIAHSMLPAREFLGLLNQAFASGLAHKLEFGRPYRELADLNGADYRSPAAAVHVPPLGDPDDFPDRCAPHLKSPTTPGPGYSTETALAEVRARYENLPPVLRHSLPRLLADPSAFAVFSELRTDGWKDWHLLNALANLVINARITARHGTHTAEAIESYQRHLREEQHRPEAPDDPSIEPSDVTRVSLEFALGMSATATALGWGLQFNRNPIDSASVLTILGNRYGYWIDDLPHGDFFGWSTQHNPAEPRPRDDR
ncbi:hypothetical protein [Glycomyces sp. MUSA5-2]|uniref:hypothetical protein n=1 Tax=Glycomyces sp. MUSA5-2 TaxID=2053002 RepID=UPI0030089F8C